MYEQFYGLTEKPFAMLPDPDFLYWGPSHSMAYAMLEYGVMNHAGFTVITGEIGCGKTTLIRHLLGRLDKSVTVGLVSNTLQTRDELLRWIMLSLGQPFENLSSVALFRQFQQFLIEEYARGRRTLLIVDEAQNLEPASLEELRMLSNINADKEQLLQIILVGQPQLKTLLQAPQLIQFAQRVSSDFHLRPLDTKEVVHYIRHRVNKAGSSDGLFSRSASSLIAEASHGIPRTINLLCDTALVYGYSSGVRRISIRIVKAVINDKSKFGLFSLSTSGSDALNKHG